ncbi:hypothetical protein [Rubinisphaera sp.]|uniref:hypothetical protein n=1 Tax=Rubinisphaera sp. TaxID=2024857 RepID=UPI000C0CB090|nr:hypothetical protein [Rubinisphaera sp.]MBV10590.1 hypothetical protein [Rubinisphaera sp.]HCS51820.1 hypothetical protein [Planctomycetaceae bacterium]|tara:strand:+ start:1736 stop:2830 length:1095 start_codon:yes stop_codon:yes gene_type:complete
MNQIFHIQNGQLIEMNETRFERETDFQSLLQKHPNLLSINHLDNDEPCRWLEIDREMRLSADENQPGRMSLDHLYLDQRAIPTLVEVKRKEDTRIRREVVGQMLDYAACAAISWSQGELQERFESRCLNNELDAETVLEEFLDEDQEPDEFWQQATANLQSGRLRILFVADQIPLELRRIIEFLNKQMNPTEVLGVELKHYTAAGLSSLVPQVIGQTIEASERKRSHGKAVRSTPEAWQQVADQKGVGEFFAELMNSFEEVFSDRSCANYGVTFRVISGRSGRLANLLRINPRGASPEKGIRYIAHIDRLTELLGVSDEIIINHLPHFEKYRPPSSSGRRYVGHFLNIDEVNQLVNFMKSQQSK